MAWATTIPFLASWVRCRRIDVGEPIYAISVLYLLFFPLRTLYLLANPDPHLLVGLRPYTFAINQALVLATLGYLSLLGGYYTGIGRRIASFLPTPHRSYGGPGGLGRAGIIFAIGLAAQLYLLVAVGVRFNFAGGTFAGSDTQNVVIQVGFFYLYGMALATMMASRGGHRGRAGKILLIAMVAAAAGLSVIYVYKAGLFYAVTLTALAFHYCWRPLRLRFVVAVMVALGLVVFPLITSERDVVYSEGAQPTGSVLSRGAHNAGAALVRLQNAGPGGYISTAVGSVMARSTGIDTLALVTAYTPALHPYQHGLDYVLIPAFAYVPRAIWPSKPVGSAIEFGHNYLGVTGTTSFGSTNFGDLYMNFGVAGVLFGAFILGAIYRMAHQLLVVKSGKSDAGIFYYCVIFATFLVYFETDVATEFVQILKLLPILMCISLFMGRAGRRHT